MKRQTGRITALILAMIMLLFVLPVNAQGSITPLYGGNESTSFTISVGSTQSGDQISGQIYTFSFSIPSSGLVTVQYSASLDVYQGQFHDDLGGVTQSASWENPTGKITYTSSQYFSQGDYDYQFQSTGNGTFSISLTFDPCYETFPETYGGQNNTVNSANPIVLGITYYGLITIDDHLDVYAFQAETNGVYRFTIENFPAQSRCGFDLYDASGNQVYSTPGYYYSNSGIYECDVNLSAGSYYLSVRNGGYYSVLLQKAITPVVQLPQTVFTYNGEPVTPAVTVMDGNKVLDPSDYQVYYYYNDIIGTPFVFVKLQGAYVGNARVDFVICGWQKTVNYWHYVDSTGTEALGWKKIDGHWYYFSRMSGALILGWVRYNNHYYYTNPATGILQTGWVLDGGNYYYFNPENGMLKTGFLQDGGKYYFFSKTTGALQTGFVKDDGNYYYFSKQDGTMQFGFVKDGGYYYFSKTDGTMQIGFVKDNGKYYYFNPSTGAMKTGWVQYAGYWFYFDPVTGAMVTGTREIGGRTYQFNSYGVCIG